MGDIGRVPEGERDGAALIDQPRGLDTEIPSRGDLAVDDGERHLAFLVARPRNGLYIHRINAIERRRGAVWFGFRENRSKARHWSAEV